MMGQPIWTAANAAAVSVGRVWAPILDINGAPAVANTAQRFKILQTQGRAEEIITATFSPYTIAPTAAAIKVDLIGQNSRPSIGFCKSSNIPITAGIHQVIVALSLT